MIQGKVAEQGTHSELMALKGLYHNLVMRQLTGNEEEKDLRPNNEKPFIVSEVTQKEKILEEDNRCSFYPRFKKSIMNEPCIFLC